MTSNEIVAYFCKNHKVVDLKDITKIDGDIICKKCILEAEERGLIYPPFGHVMWT